MNITRLSLLLGLCLAAPLARAALSPGDIAIIGFNFDNPDEFAFVALADLSEGEVIYFTDNGWTAGGSFRDNEGTHTYTVPAGGIARGTIVSLIPSGPVFSGTGDQILAYQGSEGSPTFIYALNSEGTGWQSDATSSNTSALPTGLINGTTAVALNEVDNAVFNINVIASGTQADWLAQIGNTANWSGSDSSRQTMPSGAIVVTGGGISNQPPSVLDIPDQDLTESNAFSIVVTALDPDGDGILLTASNLPPGAVFNTVSNDSPVNGTFTWNNPTPVGVYTTAFYAVDKDGVDSAEMVLSVTKLSPLVISEFMYNPVTVGDDVGEWFEVFNRSTGPIDINGWTIKDDGSDSHVINNGGPLVIPPFGFLVLGRSANTGVNGGAPVDYAYGTDITLANGDDEIVLVNTSAKEVARVTYVSSFPNGDGESLYLKGPYLDPNDGGNWDDSPLPWAGSAGDLGSPGEPNPDGNWEPPPATVSFDNLMHTPVQPTTNDTVTVALDVIPGLGASNIAATLFYSVNTITGSLFSIGMSEVTNQHYVATNAIPALPVGSRVDYYVEIAFDGPGNNSPTYAPFGAPDDPAFYALPRLPPGSVWINEINYGPSFFGSGDTNEFVELVGPAGSDISGWSIEFLNSVTNLYAADTIDKFILANETNGFGFFVLGDDNIVPPVDMVFTSAPELALSHIAVNGMVRLLNELGGVEYFLGYELVVSGGDEYIGIEENSFYDDSLALCSPTPGTNYEDFTWTNSFTTTPGAVNTNQLLEGGNTNPTPPIIVCPPDFTVGCLAPIPPAAPQDVVAYGGCQELEVTYVGAVTNPGLGCAGSPITISRTYRAVCDGTLTSVCTQVITIQDETSPLLAQIDPAEPAPVPSPTNFAGLLYWVDADDTNTFTYTSGNNVDTWLDKSGNGYHATRHASAAAAGIQRVASAINGRAAVTFAGGNFDMMNLAGSIPLDTGTNGSGVSAFVVAKTTDSGGNDSLMTGSADLEFFNQNDTDVTFYNGEGTGASVSGDALTGDRIRLVELDYNASPRVRYFVNGAPVSVAHDGDLSPSDTWGLNRLGGNESGGPGCCGLWEGDIAEIIIFNRRLGIGEANAIGRYLEDKYQLGTPFIDNIAGAPGGVTNGLLMWLDADDPASFDFDASTITRWRDKSPQHHDLVAEDPFRQPAYLSSEQNGRAVVQFADDYLRRPDALGLSGNPAVTVIAVAEANANLTRRMVCLGSTNGTGGQVMSLTAESAFRFTDGDRRFANDPLNGGFHIGQWQRAAGANYGQSRFLRDGVEAVSTAVSSSGNTPNLQDDEFLLGALRQTGGSLGSFFNGKLAELLVFDHVLTDAEMNQVGTYLEAKWGLTTAYVPSSDVTLAADMSCTAVLPSYSNHVSVLEGCGGYEITQDPPAGASLPAGEHTITMSVLDDCDNLAELEIEIEIYSTIDSYVTCPADVTVDCGNDTSDNASGGTYGDGWQSGDGGSGWGGTWVLTTSGSAGHFVGDSRDNGWQTDFNSDGDINSGFNDAWGMYANSGGRSDARRIMSTPLGMGNVAFLEMDNGWIDTGGKVGFSLDYSGTEQARFSFYFVGGRANYSLLDAGGELDTGIAFSDQGLRFQFTLLGVNTYDLLVEELGDGGTHRFSGTLAGTAGLPVDQVHFFNDHAGFNPPRDAFFNSIVLPLYPPPDPDAIVAFRADCEAQDGIHIGDSLSGSGGCNPIVIEREYTATGGGMPSCTQFITVINPPPLILCPPDTVTNAYPFVDQSKLLAADYCGTVENLVTTMDLVLTNGAGTVADPLVLRRTIQAIDDCGSASECTYDITIAGASPLNPPDTAVTVLNLGTGVMVRADSVPGWDATAEYTTDLMAPQVWQPMSIFSSVFAEGTNTVWVQFPTNDPPIYIRVRDSRIQP